MNKERIIGIGVSLIGLFITFYDTKLTGAVIGLPEIALIKVGGIVILIAGLALFASSDSQEEYRVRESKLRAHLGDRYKDHSEEERHTYNRSLRRYEWRVSKEKAYHDRLEEKSARGKAYQDSIEKIMVRTPQFERSLKGHKSNIRLIEDTIRKIGTGKGDEEVLKHGEYEGKRSIRVTKKDRIIFEKDKEGEYTLLEYNTKHYK